jgi:hypothetical protein
VWLGVCLIVVGGYLQLLEHGDGEGAEAEDGEQHDADGGELDDALVAEHVGELAHTQTRGYRKGDTEKDLSDIELKPQRHTEGDAEKGLLGF